MRKYTSDLASLKLKITATLIAATSLASHSFAEDLKLVCKFNTGESKTLNLKGERSEPLYFEMDGSMFLVTLKEAWFEDSILYAEAWSDSSGEHLFRTDSWEVSRYDLSVVKKGWNAVDQKADPTESGSCTKAGQKAI